MNILLITCFVACNKEECYGVPSSMNAAIGETVTVVHGFKGYGRWERRDSKKYEDLDADNSAKYVIGDGQLEIKNFSVTDLGKQ